MDNKENPRDWLTIPVLPCVSIIDTLSFWEMLGFEVTYKQTRPYQYGVVERNGYALHFGRVKGMDENNNFSGCLVMVSDIDKVYEEFTYKLKANLGRIPHTGVPRISRKKPGTTRFTLTDISGNAIIFISYGEEDLETWKKAEDKNQSQLQKAIATAINFRDYKDDAKAATAILDIALRKTENEDKIAIAEAIVMRIDLATFMNEKKCADEYRILLNQMNLEEKEIERLTQKHNIKL